MKPISKNTLIISAILGGSLALLTAGLYLRAMNGDTSAESTEMPEVISAEERFVEEDITGDEITDEELAAIIAEISEGETEPEVDLEIDEQGIE